MRALALLVGILPGLALAAVQGEPSAPWPTLPGDQPREAVRECTGPETWNVTMAGNADGPACRDVVGYAALRRFWQPNREVSIANLGETSIANPRLVVNDSRDWQTAADIAAEATRGWSRTADRARAVYEFQRRRRFHACTWDAEVHDAAKVFNVYGYTLCGNDATVLSDLWTFAGVPSRRGWPVGHVVSEALYDGGWHLLDGDEHCLFLLRDNETIASEADVVRDHDLIKRTHTYGILQPDNPLLDQFSASLYGHRGERPPRRHSGPSVHTMDWSLPPGASITWRWGHVGKQYTGGDTSVDKYGKDGDGDLLKGWGARAYALMCNAELEYQPDLGRAAGRAAIIEAVNLAAPDGQPALRAADPARPASITWRIATPYVAVGAKVALQTLRPSVADGVALSYSADQKSFQPLATAPLGGGPLELVLDDRLSQRLKPQYVWWLRAELTGQGAVTAVRLTTDLQTSLFGLPELELGSNEVSYRDAASAPRRVRVTQRWVERTAWQRPPAPAAPVAPAVGATIEGTRVRFEWRPVESADGLADYHFELSEHADLRWPLSPNFEKYISHTPQKGTASYETPFVGLLNPGQTYYWRVRARSQAGVWGPWGPVWSFRCAAPGTPLHVRLEALEDGRRYRLVWAANPAGRAPVAYRVYGSNEQGFTASDEPYVVDFGAGFCRDLAEYEARMADKSWRRQVTWPGNFVTEVRGTELVVAGPGLELEGANRAFYRVVAVDDQGNRSGPSDYAELPRPFIASLPPATAPAGQPYTYRPTVVTSIGHLTSKPGYLAAYWEREEPRWRLLEAPAGVRLDPSSGELTGTLPAGEHRLGIEVTTAAGSARQEWTTRIE